MSYGTPPPPDEGSDQPTPRPEDSPAYGSAPPPPPPPPGYGQAPPAGYGQAPPPPPVDAGAGVPQYGQVPAGRNTKALWSLILGIVGFLICGVILGPVAIVLGRQAKKEIAASGGRQTGAGMAQAGFILGIVALVLWALSLIVRASQMGK